VKSNKVMRVVAQASSGYHLLRA